MNNTQIIEVIDKLVGNIHAVGYTDIDNDNFVNLKKYHKYSLSLYFKNYG